MANELTINNKFIEGLTQQFKDKQANGLSVPADYSPDNALMGAYLWLKDHNDVLTECTPASIANALMDMVTMGLSVQKQQYNNAMMTFRSASSVLVEAEPDMPWTLDGEKEEGHAAVQVRNLHHAIRIIRKEDETDA